MSDIMVVLGTRPEAIKLAPVVSALRRRGASVRICATGQHRDLLSQALAFDDLVPDFDLDLMRPDQSLGALTGRMLIALDQLFCRERPAQIVVQGDTATAFASAQAAFLRQIPVAHVEAGLRTGDLSQPFPEEGLRRAITAMASSHFAPTARASRALISEGVGPSTIHITGNTVVDALYRAREQLAFDPTLIGEAAAPIRQAQGRKLVLATCHRRENHGEPLAEIARALREIAARPDVVLAIPLHPNRSASDPLIAALSDQPSAILLPPLSFPAFVGLLAAAHLLLSDSGGAQEEAPVLGTPVLVLRDRTERPEGVEAGTTILVGSSRDHIVAEAFRLLDDDLHHARMARVHSPYGDGKAAVRIAEVLVAERADASRIALAE